MARKNTSDAALDDLSANLHGLAIREAPRRPQNGGKQTSFLQAMNEKLAQRPVNPRGRDQTRNSVTRPLPSSPSLSSNYSTVFILEAPPALGVFSTPQKAMSALRRGGLLPQSFTGSSMGGVVDIGPFLRILPKRVQGLEDARIETIPIVPADKGAESEGSTTKSFKTTSTTYDVSAEKKKASPPTPSAGSVDKTKAPPRNSTKVTPAQTEQKKPSTTHTSDEMTKAKPLTRNAKLVDKTQAPLQNAKSAAPARTESKTTPAASTKHDTRLPECVYLALDFSLCLGVFTTQAPAWDACTKHKTQITYAVDLQQGRQWVDADFIPHLQGKIPGGAFHHWTVRKCMIDDPDFRCGKAI
jgi:hypothetical protein